MTQDAAFRLDGGDAGQDDGQETLDINIPTTSPRDALRATLQAKVSLEPLTLAVPARPSVGVQFDLNFEFDLINHWRNRAKSKNMPEGFDPKRFALYVIADRGRGIFMNGQEVLSEDGKPFTFYNKELLNWLGANTQTDAVRALYGVDGHILQVANRVVEAAGYGDEVDLEGDEDPT